MLTNEDAIANLAVSDLDRAQDFYAKVLGLEVVDREGDGLIVVKSGRSRIFVYVSKEAGTNRATAVSWVVTDLEAIVEELRERGVEFEHYEMPEMTRHGDIHECGDLKIVWFKDPDGNILSIVNR